MYRLFSKRNYQSTLFSPFHKMIPSNRKPKSIYSHFFSSKNIIQPNLSDKELTEIAQNTLKKCDHIRKYLHDYYERHIHHFFSTPPSIVNHQNTSQTEYSVSPSMILRLLDSLSNHICVVMDSLEFYRNVHSESTYRTAAVNANTILSEYITTLNSDDRLYRIICHILETDKITSTLSAEEIMFASDLKREYENDGIHIPLQRGNGFEFDRNDIKQLQDEVNTYQSDFTYHSTENDNKMFEFGPISEMNYNVLLPWIEKFIPQNNRSLKKPTPSSTQLGYYLLGSSNKYFSNRLLCHVESESVRRQIWKESHCQPVENIPVLGNLIKSRQKLSYALGYKSYAHKSLAANFMYQEPEEVITFINMITDSIRSKAESETKILLDMKKQLIRQISYKTPGFDLSNKSNSATGIYPSDIGYLILAYQSLLDLKKNYGGSAGYIRPESVIDIHSLLQPYFRLDTCLHGLQYISHELFGITIKQVDTISSDELWIHSRDINSRKGIIKFQVFAPSDSFLRPNNTSFQETKDGIEIGIMYLDLYNRTGKFQGSSHFTIQCGCETLSDSDLDSILSHDKNQTNYGKNDMNNIQHQSPIIALSFNINHNIDSSSSSSNTNTIAYPFLTLNELETLYHEWGHGLHSILSRTRFQHLSGTRCPSDFAEIPSHLFEYFARSPEVIVTWAKHYKTGKMIPIDLLKEAFSYKNTFQAIKTQQEVLFSAVDQSIFGTELGYELINNKSSEEVYHMAESIAEKMQRKHLPNILLPYYSIDNTAKSMMSLLSHTHFVSYGGGYYSYLFAKMYAAQIWEKRFQSNPLSRSSGRIIMEDMLRFGASKSSREILDNVAQGSLDPGYYLKTI